MLHFPEMASQKVTSLGTISQRTSREEIMSVGALAIFSKTGKPLESLQSKDISNRGR